MITQSDSENFYKTFYEQSEILYQTMANNGNHSGALGWYDGIVEDISFDNLTGEEGDVEGLHKANFNFSCLVDRTTTATINI